MLELAFAAALALQPETAWALASRTEDAVHGLNPASVQRAGDLRRFEVISVVAKPQQGLSHEIASDEVDCPRMRSRRIQAFAYATDGSPIPAIVRDGWDEVEQGCARGDIAKLVCSDAPLDQTVASTEAFLAEARRAFQQAPPA